MKQIVFFDGLLYISRKLFFLLRFVMKKLFFLPFFAAVTLSACTSVDVSQIDKSYAMDHVCIENNPEVIVSDFVPVIRGEFQNHFITTEVYDGTKPESCNFTLTYTALQSWDVTPYLSHAELRLFKDQTQIGYAEYHHNGGNMSFALNKWASVKTKMAPVIDELLQQY